MRRTIGVLLAGSVALGAQAADPSRDIIFVAYPDFVAIDLVSDTHDVEAIVVGPEGYRHQQRYASDQTAFLDTQDASGNRLADGLYKWEAWATPKKRIDREQSAAMPDRNELPSSPGGERVSGTFRVVDGMIVDPDLPEAPSSRRSVGEVRP